MAAVQSMYDRTVTDVVVDRRRGSERFVRRLLNASNGISIFQLPLDRLRRSSDLHSIEFEFVRLERFRIALRTTNGSDYHANHALVWKH